MPAGVDVLVDGPYARISFPDPTKKGPALKKLLDTGAPIEIRTGGLRREYIVPEGNAREAGLLDEVEPDDDADTDPGAEPDKSDQTSENAEVKATGDEDNDSDKEPAKKAAPAKKAPAKKAAPAASAKKEDGDA